MCKNLIVISFIVLELQVTKSEKSDVCKWRVFAKPVTFIEPQNQLRMVCRLEIYRVDKGIVVL